MQNLTIYKLLKNAYDTIDNNKLAQEIISYMGYTKDTVAIAQNRSINNSDKDSYEVIRSGKDDAIFILNFNRSLTNIDGFSLNYKYFSYSLDRIYTIESANKFLIKLFSLLDIAIQDFMKVGLSSDGFNKISINNTTTKLQHYIESQNISIIFESYLEISFNYSKNIDENIDEKYLNQEIIDMYPDYGGADFWINGRSTTIEVFEEFIDINSPLALRIEEWVSWHNFDAPACYIGKEWKNRPYFNCDEFDKVGKQLHKELQEIVKEKFIINYFKSYEENEAKRYELEEKDTREIS